MARSNFSFDLRSKLSLNARNLRPLTSLQSAPSIFTRSVLLVKLIFHQPGSLPAFEPPSTALYGGRISHHRWNEFTYGWKLSWSGGCEGNWSLRGCKLCYSILSRSFNGKQIPSKQGCGAGIDKVSLLLKKCLFRVKQQRLPLKLAPASKPLYRKHAMSQILSTPRRNNGVHQWIEKLDMNSPSKSSSLPSHIFLNVEQMFPPALPALLPRGLTKHFDNNLNFFLLVLWIFHLVSHVNAFQASHKFLFFCSQAFYFFVNSIIVMSFRRCH